MQRSSGVLMHISSLPSSYGIGTLGSEAFAFVDFLKDSGQKLWQMLPTGPTSYGDSPYQSFSTFAGNPYFIDLDLLQQEGLLRKADYVLLDWGSNPGKVDYGKLYRNRFSVLWKAFVQGREALAGDVRRFREEQAEWIADYALFMAVKGYFGDVAWTKWPDEEIRMRQPAALEEYGQKLREQVDFWIFMQYLFSRQWRAFHNYAQEKGVSLIGDLPIYVALDSAEVWAHPELFWLDDQRRPVRVAGCPPDYFSATGQLWGNPLYRWDFMAQTGYSWWMRRIEAAVRQFDVLRIDHFRGFESYYSVLGDAQDATVGEWLAGPGQDFFAAVRREIGEVAIIAEDLGFLTPEVHRLRQESGYPGMKVLQFAFDSLDESDYLPHNHSKNCVVYVGTHDNDTICGWFESAPQKLRDYATEYLRLDREEGVHWGFLRAAMASVSDVAVNQMQDFLGLGSEARMNTPSTLGDNWQWRVEKQALSDGLAKRMARISRLYGRGR
ncbi:MAG: 4-alpha-glucanotransferase [Christensenellales bacterium]|jgi:4-alpha-glucanotransferase